MMTPLSRFAPSPVGAHTLWPGRASSTGALEWDAHFAKVSPHTMRGKP